MKNKIIILLISLSSFAAIAVFAHTKSIQEGLYSASIHENRIEIIVKNNGCTKAQDFRLDEFNTGEYVLLNVVRTKPDLCRAMSRPMTVNIAIKAWGKNNHYKIKNSFITNK